MLIKVLWFEINMGLQCVVLVCVGGCA